MRNTNSAHRYLPLFVAALLILFPQRRLWAGPEEFKGEVIAPHNNWHFKVISIESTGQQSTLHACTSWNCRCTPRKTKI